MSSIQKSDVMKKEKTLEREAENGDNGAESKTYVGSSEGDRGDDSS